MKRALLLFLFVGCDLRGTPVPSSSERAAEPLETVDVNVLDAVGDESRGHIGVIAAAESVDVPSRIDGIIATVVVGIGDSVKPGDAIAKIDERPMREELAIAKAGARAAAAQRRRAGVAMRSARDRYNRRKKLGGDVLSTEDVESSRSQADQASAARSQASATAAAERTRVAQLERMLQETTITAPFVGKISQRYVGRGEAVVRGTPIVRLIAADELRVDFVVPLNDKGRYVIGDEIKILLDGSDSPIKGIVRRIAPDLDPVAQMVTAQAELVISAEQRRVIQAGMGVWVTPAIEKPRAPDER